MLKLLVMNKATLKKLFRLKSQADIARHFKITESAVSQWKINGIPPRRAIDLEKLLAGQITRHELCPELYPRD